MESKKRRLGCEKKKAIWEELQVYTIYGCCYYLDDKLFTLLILTHYAYVFLQRTFDIPDEHRRYILSLAGKRYRGWKAFLTNNYLKDKDGNFLEEAPGRPKKYEILIEKKDWVKFVIKKMNIFGKGVSQIAREHQN